MNMILRQSLPALQVLKKKRDGEMKKSKADVDDTVLETMLFGHVAGGDEGINGAGRIH